MKRVRRDLAKKNATRERRLRALVAFVLFGVLFSGATACFAATSATSRDEQRSEKNFDKALKKCGAWYSQEERRVVFLPDKPVKLPKPSRVRTSPREGGISIDFMWDASAWFFAAALVLFIVFLTWFGVRAQVTARRRARDRAAELIRRRRRIETLAVEARPRYDDLDKAADEARDRGDRRAALIFFFSWILVEMDKRSVALLDKGKTNLDYWRELKDRPQIQKIYRLVMDKFERVYFGGVEISSEELDEIWSLRAPFEELMNEEDARRRKFEEEREESKRRWDAKKWSGPKTTVVLIVALSAFASSLGCRSRDYWSSAYCEANSRRNVDGLNGIGVFYDYCRRQTGGKVGYISQYYSDQYDDFDTIVWFCEANVLDTMGWDLVSPELIAYFVGDDVIAEEGESRAEAWRAMIKRYAAASADDWTKFCLPSSNRAFYNRHSSGGRLWNSSDWCSRENIANWLKEKPGRKCVAVLTDQNNVWDYLSALREQIERDYDEPEKSELLSQCEPKRFEPYDFELLGFDDVDAISLYFMSPGSFAAAARETMERRVKRANILAERISRLGDAATPDEVLSTRDEDDATDEKNDEIPRDFLSTDIVLTDVKLGDRVFFSYMDYADAGFDFGDDWIDEKLLNRSTFWFRQYYLDVNADDHPTEARFSGDPSWTSSLPEKGLFRERVRLVPEEGSETLLSLGETPLVCRRSVAESEILLINSNSFLSNYGLTDPVNRKIAARLVQEFNPTGKIGFLISRGFYYGAGQSDDAQSAVRGTEGRFSLLKVSPFSILAWHAALLAMLAGFCAWPIFGRARRVERDQTSHFGFHVEAMANMLKKSDSVAWTHEQIDLCRKMRRRDRLGTAPGGIREETARKKGTG